MTKSIIKTKLKSITHISPHSNRNWNWESDCERASEEFAVNKSGEWENCGNLSIVQIKIKKKIHELRSLKMNVRSVWGWIDNLCVNFWGFLRILMFLRNVWNTWEGLIRNDAIAPKVTKTTWRHIWTDPKIFFPFFFAFTSSFRLNHFKLYFRVNHKNCLKAVNVFCYRPFSTIFTYSWILPFPFMTWHHLKTPLTVKFFIS